MYISTNLEINSLLADGFDLPFKPTPTATGHQISWCFENSSVSMIRVQLYNLTGIEDQLLVLDSNRHVVADFTNLRKSLIWTPWVPGDVLFVELIPTQANAYFDYTPRVFDLVNVSYISEDLIPHLTTTTNSTPITTNSTTTTSTVGYPLEGFLLLFGMSGLGICIVLIPTLLIRRRKV